MTAYKSLSMYPAMVMHRRSNLIQPRWPPCPGRPPASSLVGTRLCPPCRPLVSHGFLHWKWLRLREQMTYERHTGSSACTFGKCGTWWYFLDSLANIRDFLRRALHSLGRWNWTKEKPMSVSDRTLTKQKRCPLKNIVDWNMERGKAREKKLKV